MTSFLSPSRRLWLYALAYPLHALEEIRGVGPSRGINMSLTTFFVLSGVAWLMLVIGIPLSKRLRFPQLMELILASVVIANAISHLVATITTRHYDAGVITGTLIFIPLGVATLVGLRNSMRLIRYLTAVGLGLLAQGAIMIIS